MKSHIGLHIAFSFIIASLHGIVIVDNKTPFNLFSLKTTTTWKEYGSVSQHASLEGKKWAWACSLIFKSKQPVNLTEFTLVWRGAPLEKISASLFYKKEQDPSVIPIEQNLACQATWNHQRQELHFKLNEKIVAVTTYHLLLSFPLHIESQMKHGAFVVDKMQAHNFKKKAS